MKKGKRRSSSMRALPSSAAQPDAWGKRPDVGRDPGDLGQLVARLREGDGVDPRLEGRHRRRATGHGQAGLAHGLHQQERLISQVRMAVETALLSAAAPMLNSLTVREVVNEAGALWVVLDPRNPAENLDVLAAAQAVKRATSMIRHEVASAITRKETPNLRFVVLPAGAEKIDEPL